VAVTNQTPNTIPFQLIPADGVNTKQGGAFTLYQVPGKPLHSVGAWVRLSDLDFTMPPHTIANVPFTVDVPPGLTPGDYAGGIILQPTTPAVNQHGNVTVDLYQDVGARIYIRVRGALHPGLSVTQLSVNTSGAAGLVGGPVSSSVTYTLTNTGNQVLNPTAKLNVSPLIGSGITIPPKIFSSLLPHNSVTVTYKLASKEAFLRMNANLSISSGAGTTTATASAWVIPWIIVAIIVVLVGLLWFWRRRRRRAKVVPPPPAEPEPAGVASRV
jgi:archaellum component FlaF (FlaF/FlaG flagellin family)